MSNSVQVRGGSHSISVDFEELHRIGREFSATAELLTAIAGDATAAVGDPALIPAAVLDPVGAIEVAEQAAATVAVAATAAAGCLAVAGALEAAALSYRAADNLDGRLEPTVQALLDPTRPAGLIDLAVGALSTAAPGPWLAEVLDPSRRGAATSTLARLLGGLYSDGEPGLARRPDYPTDDASGPPRRLSDLMRSLALRNENNDGGAIDVRIVTKTGTDGITRRSAIVDITGTTEWGFTKRTSPTVSNVGTNLRAVGNQQSSYEAGVVLALRDSGVRPDEPIMLVGHSQGGLIAARLAADLARSQEFHVSHVVTAGSPIGLIDLPAGVQVLSLENTGDPVPELEGTLNPTRPNQLTARVDRSGHDLTASYLPSAAEVDACGDPSVTDWLTGAKAFLRGDSIATKAYQVTRHP